MSNLIRAVKTDVLFGTIPVDAYKLQNSAFEKRIGIGGAGESIGYAANGSIPDMQKQSKRKLTIEVGASQM